MASTRENFSHKETMPLPENVESIIHLWCEVAGCESREDTDGIIAVGRLTIGIFARMKDGDIYYFDKPLEIERKIPADQRELTFQPRLSCTTCGYTFTAGETIEIRCDLLLEGAVYTSQKAILVEDITIDEKKERTGGVAPGLYLYMAEDGETLWDIAKRYNTSIDKIVEENSDRQGEGCNNILLIPVL